MIPASVFKDARELVEDVAHGGLVRLLHRLDPFDESTVDTDLFTVVVKRRFEQVKVGFVPFGDLVDDGLVDGGGVAFALFPLFVFASHIGDHHGGHDEDRKEKQHGNAEGLGKFRRV